MKFFSERPLPQDVRPDERAEEPRQPPPATREEAANPAEPQPVIEASSEEAREQQAGQTPRDEVRHNAVHDAELLPLLQSLQSCFDTERERAERARGEVATQLQSLTLMHITVSELVEENHRLRAGEQEKTLEPVLRDLVSLADDLGMLLRNSGHASLGTAITLVNEVLERYGATASQPASLDRFDPSLHNGVARLPTGDRNLDGLIAETIAPGFRTQRTFLMYPRVAVYRYTAP